MMPESASELSAHISSGVSSALNWTLKKVSRFAVSSTWKDLCAKPWGPLEKQSTKQTVGMLWFGQSCFIGINQTHSVFGTWCTLSHLRFHISCTFGTFLISSGILQTVAWSQTSKEPEKNVCCFDPPTYVFPGFQTSMICDVFFDFVPNFFSVT